MSGLGFPTMNAAPRLFEPSILNVDRISVVLRSINVSPPAIAGGLGKYKNETPTTMAKLQSFHQIIAKNPLRVVPSRAPVRLSFHLLLQGGPIGLQLRASNEGLRRPHVARAKETNELPLLSYTGRGASTLGLLGDRTRVLELYIKTEEHDVGFFNHIVSAFET